jgi:hypothetical protein
MLKKELRIGAVSDIHMGHARNPTASICKNFRREINNAEFLRSIDLLLIVGDFYEKLLSNDSQDSMDSDVEISLLLRNCQRYGVVLRVVEGTRSHDRGQPRRFLTNLDKQRDAGLPLPDLQYFNTIHIEYIESLGIHMLYVPDDMGNTAQTLERVRELMSEMGLSQVDFAMMHGFFPHQLGNIPEQAHLVHDPQAYLALVRFLIFIGHVHTTSQYERIFAQGSFDRLAHNEEGPKGYLRAVVQPDGNFVMEFLENTGALIFKTIAVETDDVVEAILQIDRQVEGLASGSYIRVLTPVGHSILSNNKMLLERWPQFIWSQEAKDRDKKKPQVLMEVRPHYHPVILTPTTLREVVSERLKQKNYPAELVETIDRQLGEVM